MYEQRSLSVKSELHVMHIHKLKFGWIIVITFICLRLRSPQLLICVFNSAACLYIISASRFPATFQVSPALRSYDAWSLPVVSCHALARPLIIHTGLSHRLIFTARIKREIACLCFVNLQNTVLRFLSQYSIAIPSDRSHLRSTASNCSLQGSHRVSVGGHSRPVTVQCSVRTK